MTLETVLMVGGDGRRLRPYTEGSPKCLVEVAGRPMLSLQLRWLRAHGITSAVLSAGAHAPALRRHAAGEREVTLRVVQEPRPLGKSGALRYALAQVGGSPDTVLVANGDLVTDLDLTCLLRAHRTAGAPATVAVVPLESSKGIVELTDEGAVLGFAEKPRLPHWMNAGIYVFSPPALELLPEEGDEDVFFPRLIQQGMLQAFRSRPYYRGVDTHKDLDLAARGLQTPALRELFSSAPAEP